MKDYTVTTPTTVSVSRVGDLVCCALEGGSTYWCSAFKPAKYPKGTEWGHEAVAHGTPFVVTLAGEGQAVAVANSRARIKAALQVMSEKFPRHWQDFVNENEDAITGDLFFQLLVFGEEVYG